MKKRILAMLLAMALVITGLPMIVIADSADSDSSASDPLANAAWSENVTEHSDSNAPYDYVHVYGMDYHTWWLNYTDKDVTLSSAKTYRLSFATRGIARKNNDSTDRSTYVLLIDANGNSVAYTPIEKNGDFRPSGSVLIKDNEWNPVSITFKGHNSPISFRLRPNDAFEDLTPYDIRDFELYEIDVSGNNVGENLIKYANQQNASHGWSNDYGKPSFQTECDYMRVATPTDGKNTTAKLGGLVLEPGIYSVSGKFRLNTFDFDLAEYYLQGGQPAWRGSLYTAALTVAGEDGLTVEGSLPLSTQWKTGSFTLTVPEATTIGEIAFTLDKSIGFDVADLKFTQTVFYTDEYVSGSGKPAKVVNEYIADDIDEYVRLSNLRISGDGMSYTDADVNITAGSSYDVSFYIRSAYSSEWIIPTAWDAGSASFTQTSPMMSNGLGYTNARFYLNGSAKYNINTITNEWKKISTTLVANNTDKLNLRFEEIGGSDILPYDIAGLSIVESGTGTELVTNGLLIKTAASNAGWESYATGYRGSANIPNDLKIDALTAESYYHFDIPISGNTEIHLTEDDTLSSGVYYVSGDFRLPDFKSSKITFGGEGSSWNIPYIVENGNKAAISAYYNDKALGTANVTTTWSEITFELVVPAGQVYSKNDISFTFEDSVAIDFKNITFTPVNDLYDLDFADSEGNYSKIVNETIADGTNEYVRLSNIRISGDGMTYVDANVTISADTAYDVSFYIRSAHSSEWIIPTGYDEASGGFTSTKSMMTANGLGYTQVRISLNRSTQYTISPITSEWQKVTVTLTAQSTDALNLVFSEIGGEDNLPYDVAGLSIVESGTSTELATHALKVKTASDNAGWYAVTRYRGSSNIPSDLKVKIAEAERYNHINAPTSGNTELHIMENGTLSAGIYHISGNFKLSDLKSSKIMFSGEGSSWNMPYIVENGNKATVSAYYDGKKLIAVGDSSEITTDWSNVAFVLTVPVGNVFDMNKITFEFDDSIAVDFKDISYNAVGEVYIENFVSGDGTPAAIVNETDKYIHAYNIDFYSDGIIYSDPSVTLKEGTSYRLSFSARTATALNWPTQFDNGEGYRQIRFFLSSSWSAWLGDDMNNRVFDLTDDWKDYSLTFTPSADSSLEIRIREMGGYDILPFDIKDFSVVEIESETELVKYGETVSDSLGWKSAGAALEVNRAEYYHVYAPSDGSNTTININEDSILEPGIYHITGKFRLIAPIDFDKLNFTSNLTVSSDGNKAELSTYLSSGPLQLKTITGRDTELIAPYQWNDIGFVIDTQVPINMNTISIMLDGAYSLDFCDINIELIERKINISDINIGTVIVALLLKQKWFEELGLNKIESNSSVPESIVDDAIEGSDIKQYLHVSNLRVAGDAAYYTDPDVILTEGKTYEVSMYVRAANTSDWFEEYKYGNGFITKARFRLNGSATVSISQITNEWKKIVTTVKPASTGALTLKFEEIGGNDILPYDIAGVSVIEVGTTEQLIKHGTQFATGGNAGWAFSLSGYRKGSIPSDLKLDIVSTGYYNHIPAPKSEATEFNIITKETLSSGTYYVSVDLRLADYKLSNLEMSSFDTGRGFNLNAVMVDNNKTTISAYYNNEALLTTKDTTSATITTNWSNAIFAITVPEGKKLNKSDIIFKLGDCAAIDVKNVTFLNEADMAAGLARGAISEKALENWTYGDQTLEYKVDADGTKYLAASNITHNRLGFTYKSDIILTPGIYVFSGDFRASTKDETGYARVVMADTPHTIEISNEWAHMEYMVPVNTTMALEFKVCGPAIAIGTQNYDIANLSIINFADTIPNNVNLYEAGNFEDPETALENWSTYNGSDSVLTYEQDENGGFLRMSNRPNEYCGLVLESDTYLFAGYRYKISYDIRCAVEGATMVARNYTGKSPFVALPIIGEIFETHNFAYYITDEWRHIEAEITATTSEKLILRIAGGFNPETDTLPFDIDNISIIKLDN